MNEILVNVADALADAVSAQTGIKVAPVGTPRNPTPSAPTPSGPLRKEAKDMASPTLSIDKPCDNMKGRRIAILGGDGMDAAQYKSVVSALQAEEAVPELIAARAGAVADSKGKLQKVNRAAPNAPSVIYDGVIVLGGESAAALAASGLAIHFVNEAYRHGKPMAFFGEGVELLEAANLPDGDEASGVLKGGEIAAFIEAMLQHRYPNRPIEGVPA
jgi:catalase